MMKKVFYFRLIIILFSVYLYISYLCPSISSGDSGELAASAYTLGIPHPPGYPFYMMLGRLFSIIFPGNPALGMNILSSIFAIFSLLVLFQLLLDFNIEPEIAFIPVLLLCLHPLFFKYATITEVYSITAFFFLYELFLLKKKNIKLLSYILGISILIHPVLWILGVYLIYRILREDYRLIIYTFLGFSMIIYLPIRSIANPLIDWGNPETLKGTVLHLLRLEYYKEANVPFSFSIIFEELLIWFKIVLRDSNFLLLLLPFAFKDIRKYIKKEYLILLIVYSLPLVILLHFKPSDLNLEANRVFFMPQLILILILSVFALEKINKKFLPITGLFFIAVFVLLGYKERVFNRSWTSLDYIKTVLEQTEIEKRKHSPVILSKGDALTLPLLYAEVLTENIKVKINTPGLKINSEEIPEYSTYMNEEFNKYDRMLFSRTEQDIKPWNFVLRKGRKDILEDELYIKALTRYAIHQYKIGETTLSLWFMKSAEKLAWLNSHKLIVADAYSEIKNYDQSISILKGILKNEPDYEMIHHRLYYSLLKIGKIDKAENILSEGLLSFEDKNLLNDAGVYFAERGFTNTAFIFFLEGLFKGASNSGVNIKKLIEHEILTENQSIEF
jgi:hypothetical protein